jgi:hypothetical protein
MLSDLDPGKLISPWLSSSFVWRVVLPKWKQFGRLVVVPPYLIDIGPQDIKHEVGAILLQFNQDAWVANEMLACLLIDPVLHGPVCIEHFCLSMD